MGHEEIDVPLPLPIAKRYAHAGLWPAHSAQRRPSQKSLVHELAVPLVYPELVGFAIVSDVEVGKAVPGEVRAEDAQTGSANAEKTGWAGHIGERPVAVVVIENGALRGEALRGAA